MSEKSPEEIMAAQLDYDAAEAKQSAIAAFAGVALNPGRARRVVDALENLVGKLIMRWWFARIKKARELPLRLSPVEIEARRRARAAVIMSCCAAINTKTKIDPTKGPSNLELQVGIVDLSAAMRAIWQAMIDAGIIDPNAKQDYLDAGVTEIWSQVESHGQSIAPAGAGARN